MTRQNLARWIGCLAAAVALCAACTPACALAIVGTGNRPVENQNWPLGCLEVANLPNRVGYWEGPGFGGGQWQFLYRSATAEAFNFSLAVFGGIRAPRLELVLHDGPEFSHWLGREEAETKEEKARVDWTFTVWEPRRWHSLYSNPNSFFLSETPEFRKPVAAPRIDLYLGGGAIAWDEVNVPENVTVIDERAEAAPVKPVGGGVVVGDIYDMATGRPIAGAEVTLAKQADGQKWEEVVGDKTDDRGAFVIQRIPEGTYKVYIWAEGYAGRMQGYYRNKGNTYQGIVTELMTEAMIKGVIADEEGHPLAGVVVRPSDPLGIDGLGYAPVDKKRVTTDADGRFELGGLAEGFTGLWCGLDGWRTRGEDLFKLYDVPSDDTVVVMIRTGTVLGRVIDQDGQAPAKTVYISIQPPGRMRRGMWGGGAQCQEDGTFEFGSVPPGEYLIGTGVGPHLDADDPGVKRIVVKGGETVEVELVLQAEVRDR